MRKLIYSINLTIDGCLDHTKVNGSEEILEYFADMLRNADTLLYGRITYQLMVPFWPDMAKTHSGQTKAGNDYADVFDGMRDIVVVSKTLEKGGTENTRIIRGDLTEEILKLKQEPGKDILLGGAGLASQIIALGLVDEYRFVVHPILAGEGARLLKGITLQPTVKLKLIDANVMKSGTVALTYVPE